MKIKYYYLSFVVVTLIVFMGAQLPVFTDAEVPENESDKSSPLIICPEPRPQMCTMDYRPVCAELKDGSFKTFSNGCMSCADLEVVGYRDGECGQEK